MRHITISGNHGTHDREGVAFWIFAGIIMVIAFGEALAVLAAVFVIVAAVSWVYREVERRFKRSDMEMAPVTHLRPALLGEGDLKMASVDPSWHGPRAA
ncbi:hypothetical protein [Mycobacterium sp.]|uniref:hypothetical protein n=1 Tax=Mycobacterium sp. TaxID=1785 RepID=UPI002B5958C5|nr:hypothetical protein [Mycobacterium sp.]HTY32854.1 hypothetical protein [Mycobacterium sp.]